MGAFVFDPSIILTRPQQTSESLSDILNGASQRQFQQAQLGQMLYQQQRQRQLASIVQQNAGNLSAMPQALLQGGFLPEAMDAQQRNFEMGQKILGIHRSITASRIQAANGDPGKLRAITQNMPDDVAGMYGAPGQGASDKELGDWASGFLKAQLTPEEVAENTNKANANRELKENSVTGQMYAYDKNTDTIRPVGGGAGGTGLPIYPKQVQDELNEFQKSITKVNGRSNLSVDNQERLNAVDRLRSYAFDSRGNPRPLTPEQMEAAITDFGSVVAGGGKPTEGQVKALTPNTWRGSSAKTFEWLTNHPQDAGAQDFLRSLYGQMTDLDTTLGKQILKAQTSELPRFYKTLRPRDPKWFDAQLIQNGINPTLLDERGVLKSAGPRVTVRFQGRTLSIPQSRLAEALKDGAQEVR